MESDSQACGKNLINGKAYDYQVPRTVKLNTNKYILSVGATDGSNWLLRLRRPGTGGSAAVAVTGEAMTAAAAALSGTGSTWTAHSDADAAAAGWFIGPADNAVKFAISDDYDGFLVDIARVDATGAQNMMLEIGDGDASAYTAPVKCVGKIATKLRADNSFDRVGFARDVAVRAISRIVEKTVTQATNIGTLQAQKQMRPDDDYTDDNNAENCPAGKQCLLVEGTDSKPHWYEIFDPIQWFMPSLKLTSTSYATCRYTQEDGKWTYYNAFYKGDSNFRKTYIDGSTSTYDRPFASTTRCTTHSFNTETPNAEPCYNTMTGAFHKLTDGEWALVFEGGEGDNGTITNSGVKPGIVYGTSKCTSVAGPNNYSTANPTKLEQLTPEQQAAWEVLPTSSTKDNYKQCWCKMTGIGVNDNGTTVADLTSGAEYSVAGASWVFYGTRSSAAYCAYSCAYFCANVVRTNAGFRSAVLGVGGN